MVDSPPNPFEKPPEPKKHKGGIFGHEKEQTDVSPVSPELEGTINRLRVLEERYTNLQMELKVTEENMINKNKRLVTEVKTIMSDISELKRELSDVKDKVLMIIKELQGGAKKADFDALRKYVEMWEPMNFVTHKEVEEIIEEKLRE